MVAGSESQFLAYRLHKRFVQKYKYYVSGHYPSSCFYLKHRPVYISPDRR
jgi:hypothetical protein